MVFESRRLNKKKRSNSISAFSVPLRGSLFLTSERRKNRWELRDFINSPLRAVWRKLRDCSNSGKASLRRRYCVKKLHKTIRRRPRRNSTVWRPFPLPAAGGGGDRMRILPSGALIRETSRKIKPYSEGGCKLVVFLNRFQPGEFYVVEGTARGPDGNVNNLPVSFNAPAHYRM